MTRKKLIIIVGLAIWSMASIGQTQEATPPQPLEWSDSVSVGVIDKGWRFEVELYKPRTAWCEPIYIRKAIINLSENPKPLPLICVDFPNLGFAIHNAAGERMPVMRLEINILGGIDTTRMLAAGDSVVIETDLLWLGPRQSPSMGLTGYHPGEYTVDISLNLDPLNRGPREENTLVLPQLRFSVVEPTGDSAEALRLLAKAKDLQHKQPLEAEACFDSVLKYYSHTPYDELANIKLAYYHFMGPQRDDEEYVRWAERLFVKYPNSPSTIESRYRLISRITPERMKELVGMIKDKPEAAKMLRHLKDQEPWIFEEADK